MLDFEMETREHKLNMRRKNKESPVWGIKIGYVMKPDTNMQNSENIR